MRGRGYQGDAQDENEGEHGEGDQREPHRAGLSTRTPQQRFSKAVRNVDHGGDESGDGCFRAATSSCARYFSACRCLTPVGRLVVVSQREWQGICQREDTTLPFLGERSRPGDVLATIL